MGYSSFDVAAFTALFNSNQLGYGVLDTSSLVEPDDRGKIRGKHHYEHAPLSSAVIVRHFEGQTSIGASPLGMNGTCAWGCIDVDKYNTSHTAIIRAIYDYDLPCCPCYSKSRGLHLLFFFRDFTPPNKVRELLQTYLAMFALPPETEIYPLQKDKDSASNPSWVNLPYYQGDDVSSCRKMLDKDMKLVSLAGFIERGEAIKKTYKEHQARLLMVPYIDAPPCVQSGCMLKNVPQGCRNNWLFSCGVYLRMVDEECDLEAGLKAINDSLDEPIDEDRLMTTVVHGLEKKTYFYKCDSMPFCQKTLCHEREYGLNTKAATGFEYGDMVQYVTEPPYYTWEINGKKLVFYSEEELLHQTKFRTLCYRFLHTMPRRLDDPHWTKVLNRASSNIRIVEVEDGVGGFSPGSQLLNHLSSFFFDRQPGTHRSQLSLGRTFLENGKYLFNSGAVLDYLYNIKNFKHYSGMEIQTRLQKLGAVNKGEYWEIEEAAVPGKKKDSIDADIKFLKEEENEEREF